MLVFQTHKIHSCVTERFQEKRSNCVNFNFYSVLLKFAMHIQERMDII